MKTRLQKIRAWVKSHRRLVRGIGAFIQFCFYSFLAVACWNGALVILSGIPVYGAQIGAAAFILAVCVLFIKAALVTLPPSFEDQVFDDMEDANDRIVRALHFLATKQATDRAYIAELRGEGKFIEAVEDEEADMHHRLNKILDQ